jgi:pimeloyl-ACP methyl ester carboxylesterase
MRAKYILSVFLLGALALGAVACSSDSKSSDTTSTTLSIDDFYKTPSPLPTGPAGTLVRSEPMDAPAPGSQAWRVMYTSTGLNNEPIVVTGMVIAPTASAASKSRTVVSWAHPTSGIEDQCAPSRSPEPFKDVQGLSEFIANGWVVVATDYQGLGTDGPHPYLVGASEAHGTLDIVRLAGNMGETAASNKFFVFGHSQGGQAALFAGQLAPTYSPELNLLGVAAAAPAGELVELFNDDKDTAAGAVLGSYAVESWSEVFGYDTSTVIDPAYIDRVKAVATKCVIGASKTSELSLGIDDMILKGRMWKADPATTPPWQAQFAINTPAQSPIAVPVLILQGTADKIIDPPTSAQLTAAYVANGTAATEQMMPGVNHMKAGADAVPYVVPFFNSLAR